MPPRFIPYLALLLLTAAAGLLLGLRWAPLGIAAAAGLTGYFTVAIGAHLRVRDLRNLPTTLVYLALAVATLALRLATTGYASQASRGACAAHPLRCRSAAAGDSQHSPGGVGRLRTEQPDDRRGDLIGLGRAAHRDLGREPLQPAGVAGGPLVDLGSDQPWRHRVDSDPIRRQLLREPDGQCVDRRLRGGIVDVLASTAQGGRTGGDVDDRATSSPRLSDMTCAARREQSRQPIRLTSTTRRRSWTDASASRPTGLVIPALFTSPVTCPSSVAAVPKAARRHPRPRHPSGPPGTGDPAR